MDGWSHGGRRGSHHTNGPFAGMAGADAKFTLQGATNYLNAFAVHFASGPFRAGEKGAVIQHQTGESLQHEFCLVHFTLTDPNVDSDEANTNALLEVEAFNQSAAEETVALLAVFYPESGNTTPSLTINNTTGAITGSYTPVGTSEAGVYNAVPEPSSLALLALGAGGIIARRHRKKAAGDASVLGGG